MYRDTEARRKAYRKRDRNAKEARLAYEYSQILRDRKRAANKQAQDFYKLEKKYRGKGIVYLAFKIKSFWYIPNSKYRFYPVEYPLDKEQYEYVKPIALRLCRMCITRQQFASEGAGLAALLLDPPYFTMRQDLMATIRVFADKILDWGDRQIES